MRFRLRASPGNDGTVSGTLRRRHGDDFRLSAVLAGAEWELPEAKHLMQQCNAALPVEWTQREVTITLRWRYVESEAYPWKATWHVARKSPVAPLQKDAEQRVLRFE